tara:strand:- start:449 stop:2671 length:2223 start_codon:yes stop_codon:yes gene_type:complete
MTEINLKELTNGMSLTEIGQAIRAAFDQLVPVPESSEVRAVLMGQSEIEHLFNPGSFYNMLPVPDVTGTNMIVVRQEGTGVAPTEYEVTNENIAAGLVSEAMGALACYLRDIFGSDVRFIIGDGAVPGTGRPSLADDSNDDRSWSDFASVVSYIDTNFGEINTLIECWYNADAGGIDDFKDNFWPLYFGVNPDGSTFNIGTLYTLGTINDYTVDHCLWDDDAATGEKGRGIFSDRTKWCVLTPMPFNNAPVAPDAEWDNFSSDPNARLIEPARQVMRSLESEPEAQRVGLIVGPSAHITDFEGGIHPAENTNPNGKGLFAMSFAAPIATAGNKTISEPFISAIEGPETGEYIDVVVDLPNNGTLTTLRQLRGLSLPVTPSPHQQVVTGFEYFRSASSTLRPVFNESETTYPQAHRGAITITDSGSGSPKKGRVRIDMADDAVANDAVKYLGGQATAMLQTPRDVDNELFLDMLVEHIPGYYNSSNAYTYEGVAVRPLQQAQTVNVPAPPFAVRGAYYDGTNDALTSTSVVPSGPSGLMSLWLKNGAVSWSQLIRLVQMRVSGDIKLDLKTTGIGLELTVQLSDGSSVRPPFRAGTNNTNMVVGQWYHVLIAWNSTNVTIYVNDVQSVVTATGLGAFTGNLNQLGVGSASSTGSKWTGDLAHVWISTTQTLDITQSANRQKFVVAGSPQDLGANGELVTGTAPEFYFDGDGAGWNNVGTAGSFNVTGELEASDSIPGYSVE